MSIVQINLLTVPEGMVDWFAPGFDAAEVTGRVFRFEIVDSTGGNTGAVEVRVLAPRG